MSGTIEATAAADAETGTLYFGRGDGRLYALDPERGELLWSYRTRAPGRSRIFSIRPRVRAGIQRILTGTSVP